MRKVFYAPWPHGPEVIAAAQKAGAGEIIEPMDGLFGYFEIADPEAPPPQEPDTVRASDIMAAMVAVGIVSQDQAQAVVLKLTDPVAAAETAQAADELSQGATDAASPVEALAEAVLAQEK